MLVKVKIIFIKYVNTLNVQLKYNSFAVDIPVNMYKKLLYS